MCVVFMLVAAVGAQDAIAPPHVRTESADLRRLIVDGARRSATFRGLLIALDASDVTVYVRSRILPSGQLQGRIGFAGSRSARILVIELACPRIADDQIAILAHELRHAVEIAQAPSVVDARTLGIYYEGLGAESRGGPGAWTFETREAREVGDRVRREMVSASETWR